LANWDAGSLTQQQLGFIRDARTTPGRTGITYGHWRGGPNKRIVINPAFPSARGTVAGHELGHEGLYRYGVREPEKQKKETPVSHGYIDAYLARNYGRRPKHYQSGQDVSRPMEAPILRGKSSFGGRRYGNPAIPATADKGIQRALDSMTRRMSQSAEGVARQKWYDDNRNRLLQMIFRSERQGRGR
jgi:hypothetical protein